MHYRRLYYMPEEAKRRLCRRKRRDAARLPNGSYKHRWIGFIEIPGGRIDGNSDLEHGSGIVGLHTHEQSSLPEVSCSSSERLPSLLQRFEPIHHNDESESAILLQCYFSVLHPELRLRFRYVHDEGPDGPDRRDETRGRGHFHPEITASTARGKPLPPDRRAHRTRTAPTAPYNASCSSPYYYINAPSDTCSSLSSATSFTSAASLCSNPATCYNPRSCTGPFLILRPRYHRRPEPQTPLGIQPSISGLFLLRAGGHPQVVESDSCERRPILRNVFVRPDKPQGRQLDSRRPGLRPDT